MPTWPSTSITSVPAYTVGSCGENGAVPAKRLPSRGCPSASSRRSRSLRPQCSPRQPPCWYTPLRRIPALAGVFLAAHGALYLLLARFTDSTVPFWDSLTTALSIVAMWMLSRKYAEQWLVWIAVDIVSAGLYFYKGLCPTGVLYTLYAVAAVAGYFKWLKMMKNGKTTLPDA